MRWLRHEPTDEYAGIWRNRRRPASAAADEEINLRPVILLAVAILSALAVLATYASLVA